jgi:hypothetical protein
VGSQPTRVPTADRLSSTEKVGLYAWVKNPPYTLLSLLLGPIATLLLVLVNYLPVQTMNR